jgi:hypothetical protein
MMLAWVRTSVRVLATGVCCAPLDTAASADPPTTEARAIEMVFFNRRVDADDRGATTIPPVRTALA